MTKTPSDFFSHYNQIERGNVALITDVEEVGRGSDAS